MNINIKKIKITTITHEVRETLKSGQPVVFLGRGSVVEARFKDNQDGTHNATYMVKPEITDVRLMDSTTSIVDDVKVKKKSRGQSLRHKAFAIAQDLGLSEKALYNGAMDEADQWLDNKRDEEVGL